MSRLIKHNVETVRTKLDRIYLEALRDSTANRDNADEQEVVELQEELESLYAEILPVAQMSVEQQFLEPALHTVTQANGRGQERTQKAMKYVCISILLDSHTDVPVDQ